MESGPGGADACAPRRSRARERACHATHCRRVALPGARVCADAARSCAHGVAWPRACESKAARNGDHGGGRG
eukprot:2154235-Alexandrium_andersonii.AAC.1